MRRRIRGFGAVPGRKGKQRRPPEWGCRSRRPSATRREISTGVLQKATVKLFSVAASLCEAWVSRLAAYLASPTGRQLQERESTRRTQFAQAFHFLRSGFT